MINVIMEGIPPNSSGVSNLRLCETRSRVGNSEEVLFPGVIIMIMPILNVQITVAFWQNCA